MIRLQDILFEMMLEKKADRCKRIADRKYDKPSAYKSGAIVRCRKGKIWKNIKENELNELGKGDYRYEGILRFFDKADKTIQNNILNIINNNKQYSDDEDIKDRTDLENYMKQWEKEYSSEIYNELFITEAKKETLRTWFKRKGAPGKTGGWVDCNTCREVDGKTKCKPCGRQKGEKRAKYPSCRPTVSACKQPGKGKKWGKTK
jgi:hypothetical protein